MSVEGVLELRKRAHQPGYLGLLETAVGRHRAVVRREGCDQALRAGAPWVPPARCEELVMAELPVGIQVMQRPLERDHLVGARSGVERDGGVHGLEVEVPEGRRERAERLAEALRDEGPAAAQRIAHPGLKRRQRYVVREQGDPLVAGLLQRFPLLRAQAGEVVDPVGRLAAGTVLPRTRSRRLLQCRPGSSGGAASRATRACIASSWPGIVRSRLATCSAQSSRAKKRGQSISPSPRT